MSNVVNSTKIHVHSKLCAHIPMVNFYPENDPSLENPGLEVIHIGI